MRWRLSQFREAAKSIIAQKGYDGMTMQDLADAANVSVGLVYQYVKSKEQVLLLVIEDLMDAYHTAVTTEAAKHSDPVEALAAGFGAYVRVVDRYRKLTSVGYREYADFSPEARERTQQWELRSNQLLENLVKACIDGGQFRPVAPHLISYDLVVLAHMWSLKHWDLGRRMSVDEFAAHQVALIVESCLQPRRRARYHKITSAIATAGGAPTDDETGAQ